MSSKFKEALTGYLTTANLALALAVLLGVALRSYRLSEPFGGFHSFNEAFYFLNAQDYLKRGILSVFTSPSDFNNPPLYTLFLVLSLKIFGSTEAAARGVSVAASALTILYVFKLGKILYNEKIGLLASVAFAFLPGSALVGRNVQLESLLLFFITSSAYYYLLGLKKDNPLFSLIGGALLGLGIITKLPAILSIPAIFAWESWRRRSLAWISDRRTIAFAAGFAIFGLPWYVFQFAVNRATFIDAQEHLASTFKVPDLFFFNNFFVREMLWMLSPPLFVAFLASSAWMLYRRQPSDVLILLLAAANLVFYAFYNFHTYYLIQIAPYSAIAIGRGIYSLRITSWKRVAYVSVAMAAVSFFFAFLLLAGQKYGKTSLADLEGSLGLNPSKLTIEVDKGVMDNYGPVLKLYVKRARLLSRPPAPGEKERKGDVVFVLDRLGAESSAPYALLPEKRYRLVLFGYAFSQYPPMLHFFTNGSIVVEKVGGPFDFGVDAVDWYSPFAVYVPKKQ